MELEKLEELYETVEKDRMFYDILEKMYSELVMMRRSLDDIKRNTGRQISPS